MKSLAIISPHSFVDVITNSSSELFIIKTERTAETVKKIVEELARLYNQRLKFIEKSYCSYAIDVDNIWTNIFGEPYIAEFDFPLTDFPRYHDWARAFHRGDTWYSDGRNLSEPLKTCFKKAMIWEHKHPGPLYPKKDDHDMLEAYEKKYKIYVDARNKMTRRVYAPWSKFIVALYTDLYNWLGKVNGVDIAALGPLSIKYPGEHGTPTFDPDPTYEDKANLTPAQRMVKEVEHGIDWNYTFKKGDIFLPSATDNSIPSDFWPDIESTFLCQRRHLG